MHAPVVIVGVGELAGPFSLGFLRLDYPVFPVTRATDRERIASEITATTLTLVTVREGDLDEALHSLPAPWRHSVGLVQNDLVPSVWHPHHLEPTVAVVWFEKKPGKAPKVIRPTPIGGPQAGLLVDVLGAVGIPAAVVDDDSLIDALVSKNLYIGVANISGLQLDEGATVGELWAEHRDLAESVAEDVLDLQERLVGRTLDREALVADLVVSIEGDTAHVAKGRSAPQRLERAIELSDEHQLAAATLRRVSEGV